LDSSSTSLAIAHYLKQHRHVTVITNSLEVTRELFDAPAIDPVLIGGALQRATASLIGGYGLDILRSFHVQKGFFGAHGIDLGAGLTDVSPEEAAVKRQLVERCTQITAVLDATKWGRVGIASFAAIDEIDAVITDGGAPLDLVETVRKRGVEVQIV
jgi:DeoR/GlpR family transcriptional regulator of sugar metabolism